MWLFVFGVLSTLRSDLVPAARAPRPQRILRAPSRIRRKGAHIMMTLASGEQRRIDLSGQPVTFGRADDNMVILDDDYTSAHHARIVQRERGWAVEDCGSTNGTWVDRRRITGATLLQPGQRIRVGRTELEVRT